MDYEAVKRLRQLVTTLSDAKQTALDADKLADLKALLKPNEELVACTVPLLLDRLAANHAQTRKLCVDLCAVLFSRSKCFRQLLAQQFTTFVELAVGHRSDQPLPAPPAAAQALRARALEVVEEWHETWGTHYPQVTVAYRYLKKQYKFPEIASRAAAAAAEAAARLHRHQQLLLQRYDAFKADFPQQRRQVDSLIRQLQECFELLNEQPQQQGSAGRQPTPEAQHRQAQLQPAEETGHQPEQQQGQEGTQAAGGSPAAASEDEEQWEDVPAAAGGADADAAYDDASLGGFDLDELFGEYPDPASTSSQDAELAGRNAVLLDQLTDLTRQAALAARRPLLEWLRLITQVQLQEPPQQQTQRQRRRQQQQQQEAQDVRAQQQQRQYQEWQQERQGFLREVVRLRARLQSLIEEATTVWGVSATLATKDGTAAAAAAGAVPVGAVTAAAAGDAAGGAAAADNASQPDSINLPDLSSLPSRTGNAGTSSRRQQQQEPARAGRTARQLTVGGNLQRLQQQQQQQQQAVGQPAVADAYAGLRDPTVAVGTYTIPQDVIARNEQLKFFSSPPDAGDDLGTTGINTAAAAAGGGEQGTAAQSVAGSTAQQGSGGRAVPCSSSSAQDSTQGLKPEVFKKLLNSAPQLPISGQDWLLAEYGVNQHGMELYNHWGAVDASVGLPKDRLGQLMGYAASYYNPSRAQADNARPLAAAAGRNSAGAATGPSTPADERQHQPSLATMPAQELALGGQQGGSQPTSSGPSAVQPGATPGGAGAAQKAPSMTAAHGGEELLHMLQQQQQQQPPRTRAGASAYNRAVLAGAFTDEGIAAALQQQLNEEAAAAAKASNQGRARKAPERKGDKIRRKLLG